MGASDMKKFILHILVFFAIVTAVDYVAGKVFRYIQIKAGGRTGAEWYACKEMKEDIIIMGSSRAIHHYVPRIIADSLGMSCFNAGQDGNGIILQYGRWKMISERYTPKLIIYDVNTCRQSIQRCSHLHSLQIIDIISFVEMFTFPKRILDITNHIILT